MKRAMLKASTHKEMTSWRVLPMNREQIENKIKTETNHEQTFLTHGND